MDIALLSMALSQSHVQQQTSIAVLKETMDQTQNDADGFMKMLSSADISAIKHVAQPHLGRNIDLKG